MSTTTPVTKSPSDLEDDEYVLTDGAAWFAVGPFAVRIYSTDEGIVVDIYENYHEIDGPIASTYAFHSECTHGEENPPALDV